MRVTILFFFLLSIGASRAEDQLSKSRRAAHTSIQREMKALESSRTCVDSAPSLEAFENCNYDPENFGAQKEEAPDTGTTTEKIKRHAPTL